MAKTPSSKIIVYHERARGRGVVRESSIDHIVPRPASIPHGRFTYAATATRRIKIDLRLSVQSQETEEEAAERRWDALFAASQDLLAELADKALADYHAGRTTPLDPDQL